MIYVVIDTRGGTQFLRDLSEPDQWTRYVDLARPFPSRYSAESYIEAYPITFLNLRPKLATSDEVAIIAVMES